MLKYKTELCIPYSSCPTVYVNIHLSCLTYGRIPTKGRKYVKTCILERNHLNSIDDIVYFSVCVQTAQSFDLISIRKNQCDQHTYSRAFSKNLAKIALSISFIH